MSFRISTHTGAGLLDRLARRLGAPGGRPTPRRYRAQRSLADRDAVARLVATAIYLLSTGTTVAALGVWLWRGAPPQPAGFVHGPIGVAAVTLTALVYGSVGLFLIRRATRNTMGWLFLVIAVGMAVVLPISQLVEVTVHPFRSVPLGTLLLVWGLGAVQLPASGAAVVAVLVLFPSGRPEWRHWRLTAGLAAAGAVLLATSTALRPEGLLWYPTLPNPMAAPDTVAPLIPVLSTLGIGALVTALAMASLSLVRRYFLGDPRQRRQILWVAVGTSTMAVTVATLFVARYADLASDQDGERLVLAAAIGATLLPLSLVRFTHATASRGQEVPDVTFLFTDLTDSTAMYERYGDAPAFDVVRVHLDTLESATRRHGGTIVKTIGDAVMAVFPEPAAAVATALEMFDRLERFDHDASTLLDLRVGVHRGPAIAVASRGRTDYFGQTVNIASRMETLATGGELVLSDETYRGAGVADLLAGQETRMEVARVKGVAEPILVHRVPVLEPTVSSTPVTA